MSRKSVPTPVGGSSLLVIFAVLTLTVFALLGLATVRADVRMADENRKAIGQYYEADQKAENILSKIRQGKVPSEVQEKKHVYAYSVPVSRTQVLSVVVKVDGDAYQIFQWKEINSKEWNPDKFIKVWTPD
ncbi:hypothetical protein SAMN02910358_01765 [Lachnospiraceae bacterium XBB1006]|nr:hypothetical protein SAMN02910358_01765 [Lachnospiraceae bacterium XBB1006]